MDIGLRALDIGYEGMTENGQYIYAIVDTDEEKSFGPIGIGGKESQVYTVCYQDIGAVISPSPIVKAETSSSVYCHTKLFCLVSV